MKRLHTTYVPLKLNPMMAYQFKQAAHKPTGLWYAFNDDWLAYWYPESLHRVTLHVYELILDLKNILTLKSKKNVHNFIDKYGALMHDTTYYIYWNKVAQEYKGIEVMLNDRIIKSYDYLFSVSHTWLRTWDISSGCIWDPSCIKELKESK